MTAEKSIARAASPPHCFDDRHGRYEPARPGDRGLSRPEDVRRHRARVPEGPPAADRHTDLDAQRPVIWNIGALATSGHPGVIGPFPQDPARLGGDPRGLSARLIDVELDGRKYQELHVDGGAIAQLFLYPASIDLSKSGVRRVRHAYIIRNARLDPDYAASERRTISIAGRAINTMLASSGQNDVLRTYFITQRDGVDYNLAYIGMDFKAPRPAKFDQVYMNALYQYGYQQAKAGRAWHKTRPASRPCDGACTATGGSAFCAGVKVRNGSFHHGSAAQGQDSPRQPDRLPVSVLRLPESWPSKGQR